MFDDFVFHDDPYNRPPDKEIEGGWVAHVFCDGARWHVSIWDGKGCHCSEPKCILNKPKE